MPYSLCEGQQSPIRGGQRRRNQTCQIIKGLESSRLFRRSIPINQTHGHKALIEIGEQAEFRICLHGLLHGYCGLDYFDIVFRAVQVYCVLDVDKRVRFEVESRYNA